MSKKQTIPSVGIREHPAVRAWQALHSNREEPAHIGVVRQKAKGGVFRLTRIGRSGLNVIAKRCHPDKGAVERAVYEGVFPRLRGAPLRYYGSVEEEGGSWLWLFLEDVGNEHLDQRSALERELAARWLGQVQAAIGPDDLPDYIPIRDAASYQGCLRCILRAVDGLRARSRLDKPSSEFVERIGDRCSVLESRWSEIETLSASVPTVFAHNDCLPKNVLVRRDASATGIAFIDWGGAGWAPAGADLGLLALRDGEPSDDEPDYRAYMNAVSGRWPELDLASIRVSASLGQLFWALKVISRELPQLEGGWRDPRQTYLRLAIYERTLLRSFQATVPSSERGSPT